MVLQSVTFTTLASANTYFTDNPIDLGSISGTNMLQFQLSETTSTPNASYDATLIFGDATAGAGPVPEPATFAAFGLFGAMLVKRRRRC